MDSSLRIKEIAKQKGMTMAQIAKELDINPVNLSSALNGNPTLSTLKKVAEKLGVDVADLFSRKEKAVSGTLTIDGKEHKIESLEQLKRLVEIL